MWKLTLALALCSPMAMAAPDSGLKNTDSFTYSTVYTFSKDIQVTDDGAPAVCIGGQPESLEQNRANSPLLLRLHSAHSDTPCTAFGSQNPIPVVAVAEFTHGDLVPAIWNDDKDYGSSPGQYTFKATIPGSQVNAALKRWNEKCQNKNCEAAILWILDGNGMAMGFRFPFQYGSTMGPESSALFQGHGGSFEIFNLAGSVFRGN